MKFQNWLEDQLDKIIPQIIVKKTLEETVSVNEFNEILNMLSELPELKVRHTTGNGMLFSYQGKSFSCDSMSIVLPLPGKDPKPKMYESLKSKIKIARTSSGHIQLESYEHIACLDKEKEAYKTVLKNRLDTILEHIT